MVLLFLSLAFAIEYIPMALPPNMDAAQPNATAALNNCYKTISTGYNQYLAVRFGNSESVAAQYRAANSISGSSGELGALASAGKSAGAAQLAQFQAIKGQCVSVCTASKATISAPLPAPPQPALVAAQTKNLAEATRLLTYCNTLGTINASETGGEISNMMIAQMGSAAVQNLSKAFGSSSSSQDSSTTTPTPTQPRIINPTAPNAATPTSDVAVTPSGYTAPTATAPTTQTAATGLTTLSKSALSTASVNGATIALSGPVCLQRVGIGQPMLNSSQCLQGLQKSCDGNTTSACQNFTNFYCAQGAYDTSLTSSSGTIQPGGGVVSSYTMGSAILQAHGLVNLGYCQRQSARAFCTSTNLNCLSCKSLYGQTRVTVTDVLTAKGTCFKDPVYQAGVYDVLVSSIPH